MSRIRKQKRINDRTKKRNTKLSVQALEARKLLAGDIGLSDGMLSIIGSDGDDVAEVYLHEDSVQVKLTTQSDDGSTVEMEESFGLEDANGIIFQALGGDDLFVNETSLDSIIRAGSGNDTVLGGDGNDVLVAGAGDDVVLTGGGNDIALGGPGDDVIVGLDIEDPEVAESDPAQESPSDVLNDEISESEDTAENTGDSDTTPEDSADFETSDSETNPDPESNVEPELSEESESDSEELAEADTESNSDSSESDVVGIVVEEPVDEMASDDAEHVESDCELQEDDADEPIDEGGIEVAMESDLESGEDIVFGGDSPLSDALLIQLLSDRLNLA